MSAVLKFLAAARSLANQGLSKEAIQQFAKNMIKVLFYNNFKFNNKSIVQLKKSYNSKYEIKKILSFSKLN